MISSNLAVELNNLVIMYFLKHFDNLLSIAFHYADNKKCKDAITKYRWQDGDVVCPYCGKHLCKRSRNDRFHCTGCNSNFSCLVGTIFENTKLPLVKWFMAMFLISSHKKGISSYQLARDIDISQKSAWYVLQKIRTLYAQNDAEPFVGTVECDEVYIGGKEKWKHKSMRTPHTQGRCTKTKTPVFGMIQRSYFINENGDYEPMSYVHAMVVNKTDKATLQPIIEQFVSEGSRVVTDELSAYNGLSERGYLHDIVKHGAEEYANDDIFTNSIEGFWSHLRRMIFGCYHDVSDKYLQRYIDEAVYRWNTRKASQTERFSDMFAKSIGLIVKWKEIDYGLVG